MRAVTAFLRARKPCKIPQSITKKAVAFTWASFHDRGVTKWSNVLMSI